MKKRTVLIVILIVFSIASCNRGNSWNTVKPLKEIYKNEFLMGNIIRSSGDLEGERFNIIKRHFNIATAENNMRPYYLAPRNEGGEYQFREADRIVDGINKAGMKMHGHTLVWHSQTPLWLYGDRETALANMEKYITDIVTYFKGRVYSWDVVNEAIAEANTLSNLSPEGDWRTCLRNSNWLRNIGPEYIERAFLAARAADPDALLYYNDFAMNWNLNNSNANKAKAAYYMIKDINERYPNVGGRPLIDGIGMQSHHHLNTSPETIAESIRMFSSLGIDIAITEMDIVSADGGGISLGFGQWTKELERRQAEHYAAMFRIIRDNAQYISRVTFWGLDDGTSWRADNYPTLMDKDFCLKPAFFAVMNPDSF